MTTITLHKNKTDALLRGHPWIFSGAIQTLPDHLKDGDLVRVQSSRGVFLAVGHFQHATIAVRVLSFQDRNIDQAFWNERIFQAISLRKTLHLLTEQNNMVRLVHGEGDLLPGLIIDFYNGVAVVQCHSIGMHASLSKISKALIHVMPEELKAIYSKSSDTLPERVETNDGFVYGSVDVPHQAKENGVWYQINWITGQKTGFFIDQRDNRSRFGQYAAGKKVLNTFCYSGGFSLSALQYGAQEVHSLDSSEKALELCKKNVALNQFTGHHAIIQSDTGSYLRATEEKYDLIVLDPPAYAKRRDKRHNAVQGYKRLNTTALRLLPPGGILFTFSCSQVVDKQLFNHTVIAAAIEAQRNVRILEQLHQPADHPINAFHPEGEYLKGLVLQVIN
jgi:23S rRNA (cytosine1962-C5)-methyltransferase